MENRLSKWVIPHYLFENLIRHFLVFILIIETIKSQNRLEIYLSIFIFLSVFKLLKGIIEWIFTKYKFTEEEIIIVKGIFKQKKVECLLKDIQGMHIQEGGVLRKLGVFHLMFNLKGKEGQNCEMCLKCIPLVHQSVLIQENNIIKKSKSWLISNKDIFLITLTSITATYMLTLFFIKDELKQYKEIPVLSVIVQLFDTMYNSNKAWVNLIITFTIGILCIYILNYIKLYKFHLIVYEEKIVVYRGLFNRVYKTLKLKDISSFVISSTFISQCLGFSTLRVEGENGNDSLTFVIIPFEKKEVIYQYLSKWFQIDLLKEKKVQKNNILKGLSIGYILVVFIISCFCVHKFTNSNVPIVVLVYLLVHLTIKNLYSYIQSYNDSLIVYKAGLRCNASHILLSEIIELEVENNNIQKKFGIGNLTMHIISNSDSKTFKMYNLPIKEIIKIVNKWKKY